MRTLTVRLRAGYNEYTVGARRHPPSRLMGKVSVKSKEIEN